MDENEIAKNVVDVAFKIHTTFGPGLFENVYEELMAYELQKREIRFARQVELPLVYEGVKLQVACRADLIVEEKVIVELKSVERMGNVHKKQLLTYLKLSKLRLGLLINFNETLIKNGIVRTANGMPN